MSINSNIDPFCLLNGKMHTQLFDYTHEELDDFHKAIQPSMLSEVYDAVEAEYNVQSSSTDMASVQDIADYISCLSPSQLDKFGKYIQAESFMHSDDVEIVDTYLAPAVEVLEGYIAISSSNLQALEKFKNQVANVAALQWEHRIKKHGDVTIHSYIFNLNEDSVK